LASERRLKMSEMKKIEAMQPEEASHVDVVVAVPKETLYREAERFRRQHLDDGPGADERSPEDLELMAGAFVTLAGWLPITNFGFLDWLASSRRFGGKAMLKEYAEQELGMRRPEDESRARDSVRVETIPASLCIGGDVVTQEHISRARLEDLAKWVFGNVPWPEGAQPTEIAVDINEDGHDGPPVLRVTFDECRPGVEREWSRTFVAKDA
jgi:hypothetical protein